ncbi:hypothetical protein Q8F55_000468 [Vanrija albida]|uniref:Uncharacterized protein n=1 Tax=Vanrija albida TaxID=181172 RepID=A0ABR3QDC6_9TREE
MRDYSDVLKQACALMAEIQEHVRAFDPAALAFVPPVIDNSTGNNWRGEETQGMRKFIDVIEHHAVSFEALAASGEPPREDPLPIALGLATSWKQVVLARGPIPAVRMQIQVPGQVPGQNGTKSRLGSRSSSSSPAPTASGSRSRPREAFVDVVARGGAEWIRIYSKKTNQIMAEFREQDSYLNSDDESDDDSASASAGDRTPPPLTNSIIRLVDDLLALADDVERVPGAPAPQLTLRLSRIAEFPEGGHPDPRVPATFQAIRDRGVNLVFGDLSEVPFSALPTGARPPPKLRPSRRLNLDPTALMGLCSDLLHYPLPVDEEEARARFFRPAEFVGDDDPASQSQNSRELVRAVMEECETPLIEVIRDALATPHPDDPDPDAPIELWATNQAVQYLRETISSEDVVGDGAEQRRMRRLTGLEEGDFWEGSRYEGKAGVLTDIKLHIFDDDAVDPAKAIERLSLGEALPASTSTPLCRAGMTSFHKSIAAICTTFVSEYYAHEAHGAEAAPALPSFLNPRRLPAPRVAQISTPFTVVSLDSLARGAREGMTTLSMGHVVFRELFGQPRWRIKGWAQGNYDLEDGDGATALHAAAWILPYRSLSEGKRVKFAEGNFAYPTFVQRVPRSAAYKAAAAAEAEAAAAAARESGESSPA